MFRTLVCEIAGEIDIDCQICKSIQLRAYNGGLGQSPSGIQGQSPWPGGLRGLFPKLNAFLRLLNLMSWPNCPKFCFYAKQKIFSVVWWHGPSGPLDPLIHTLHTYTDYEWKSIRYRSGAKSAKSADICTGWAKKPDCFLKV